MRLAWLIAVTGCGLSTDRDPEPTPPPAPPKIDKIGDLQVDVFVDKLKVTALSREQLRAGVRLDEVLANHPYLGWASITAYGDSVGPVEWLEPVTNYAGLVPYVFLDGGAGALALVDPSQTTQHDARVEGIDEIRITLAPKPRTPLESLAARCVPPDNGEAPPEPGPKKWRGTTYQFNIPMHWHNEMSLDLEDLANLPVGSRVGIITSSAPDYWSCRATLYRVADRHGRRAMIARVRKGDWCVDAFVEVACKGSELELWGYYADNGKYVENGTLKAVP